MRTNCLSIIKLFQEKEYNGGLICLIKFPINFMKILIISHMYPSSYSIAHGIFVHKQLLELVKQGCEVKVVKPVPWAPFPVNIFKKKWSDYSQVKNEETIDGIKVYYPKYLTLPGGILFEYSGYSMYFSLRRLLKSIYNIFAFDIIHSHVAIPDGFAGLLLKNKCFNKPLIVTIHGQDLQNTIYRNKRCFKAVGKVIKSADKIITVSTKLKRIADSNFGFKENIKVINNGIDPSEVPGQSEKENKPHETIILSVSNLIESKGIDLNIEAISKIINKCSHLKYYIIGDGPEKRKLQSMAIELGLANIIIFLGRISHEEVLHYMMEADIFSLPSWNEGFGVVYIEAMSCGKPVVACQGQGIEDVIKHNENGILVKPRDVDSLATELNRLIVQPEEAKLIGKKARETVLSKFTWENNAKQTIKLYEEVLKDAGN